MGPEIAVISALEIMMRSNCCMISIPLDNGIMTKMQAVGIVNSKMYHASLSEIAMKIPMQVELESGTRKREFHEI